ncbi:hypothetical protein HERIO_1342 [Hepatospora eriocheir]|uniref:Uncharacterized protein n=1 Tax=Hepatospora eriocheir TaxID=1081669 RepID=A0A1X0QAM9_9MICR|nr:hypothetical protein HERIO_1342 [Hepatospora eriocheir]
MIIYLLYYRYSVEFGVATLTFTESIIINITAVFLIISIIKAIFTFILFSLTNSIKIFIKFYFVYQNYDQLVKLLDKNN